MNNFILMLKQTTHQLVILACISFMSISSVMADEAKTEDPIMALLETRAHLVSEETESAENADSTPDTEIKVASYSAKGEDPLGELLQEKVLQQNAVTISDSDPLGLLLKNEVIAPTTDKRQKAVDMAFNYLNIPYKWGGNTAVNGFDCSGLVRAIYLKLGKSLPRSTADQASATNVIKRSQLQPGDLVFFNTNRRKFSHVGIYVGDDKFIHSPRTGTQVRIEELSSKYWNKRFTGARRVDI